MLSILKPLLGLALFFGRLQAETPYEALCNSPPSQPQELEPGVTVTYKCGHAFWPEDWTREKSFAATPKACALQCAQWSSEGRCGWQDNVCYLYNAGKNSASMLGGVAIYVKTTSSPVPDCSAITDQCNQDIAAKENTITSQRQTITRLEDEKRGYESTVGNQEAEITRLQSEKEQLQVWLDFAAPKIGPGAQPCSADFLDSSRIKSECLTVPEQ